MRHKSLRTFIGLIALAGTTLFGTAFILSYLNPGYVESVARHFIQTEVQHRVDASVTRLSNNNLLSRARQITTKNSAEIAEAQRKLAEGLPHKVALVVAEMRNLDCECRNNIEISITNIFEGRITELARLNERLESLIRAKYMQVAESLTREFRIFTGANTIVFALLGLTVLLRKNANLHLVLPAMVLLGAASVVGYLYLFNQNWLHTIIFSDYVGWGYFAYLGVATALLVDIAYNKARIGAQAINSGLHVIGSAITVPLC